MEVSTSEQESEYSNLESMSPQSWESPSSSPSQQVTQVLYAALPMGNHNNEPFLHVVEQPARNFRFRYKSEMIGTHGCILGRSSGPKAKTHPTVELMNWKGPALIRVRLVQADCEQEHPHKLLEDEQEDCDVTAKVPERNSYRVAFPGMGIIHTAKKDVPALLFTKLMKSAKDPDIKKIRAHCEKEAKAINLNKVRLMFSAHDIHTNREICHVFSDAIHNMKSASTNDLKICRIDRVNGRAKGGDDVYLLVEKVNKKNIMVRFFELNEEDVEVWSERGHFSQSDVHHQYAIVVRTPPYHDHQISSDVRVFIELVRPTDGRRSDPIEFTYKADQMFKNKKRRINSSLSSIGSGSGGSINSLNDIPITVRMMEQNNGVDASPPMYGFKIEVPPMPSMQMDCTSDDALAEALLSTAGGGGGVAEAALSQMLTTPSVDEPPVLQINSSEFTRLLNQDKDMPSEYRNMQVPQDDFNEYLKVYSSSINDKALFSGSINDKSVGMEFIRSMQLVADSGRSKVQEIKQEAIECDENGEAKHMADKLDGVEYSAHYKTEDGQEVKKLVKEICEIIKNKKGFKKQAVCSKLERLMEIRLSNGDTFLHMTLASNQPSFEYIVRLIHSMRMSHLLNLTNSLQQSILHLAVVNDLPRAVPTLVSRGCDPVAGDREGNSPLHYAVLCRSCLGPLLAATRQLPSPPDIDVYNNEKQTPLHVAALNDAADAARLLLSAGASYTCGDREGRTPLHLAVYDDHYDVTAALLEFIPASCIDAEDGRGNSALQILCSLPVLRKNTLRILQLLLDKQADPLKHSGVTPCAWRLARHSAVRSALRPHVPASLDGAAASDEDVEVKSEPEDAFESADEGDTVECGLPLYAEQVSTLLAAGGWRRLARRLSGCGVGVGLERRCEAAAHPASTLLAHLQESSEGLTSKALAMHLQEIGEIEAADIVRKYI